MLQILDAGRVPLPEILARTEDARDVSGIVAGIIEDVRKTGDAALLRYAMEFDRAELEALEVPREQMDQALADMEPDLRDVRPCGDPGSPRHGHAGGSRRSGRPR